MTPDELKQMHTLCQQMKAEPDRQKFTELVDQLIALLEHNQVRLDENLTSSGNKPQNP